MLLSPTSSIMLVVDSDDANDRVDLRNDSCFNLSLSQRCLFALHADVCDFE